MFGYFQVKPRYIIGVNTKRSWGQSLIGALGEKHYTDYVESVQYNDAGTFISYALLFLSSYYHSFQVLSLNQS